MVFANSRALLVGVTGHDRGDRTSKGAAFVAVVAVAVAHDERAEIGIAEPERAEDVRVLRDLLDRVAGVIDDNFLRGNEDPHGRLEAFDVERAIRVFELHQVQRGQIAGGVIEERYSEQGLVEFCRPFLCRYATCEWWNRTACRDRRRYGCLRRFCAATCARLSFRRASVVHPSRPPFAFFHGGVHELVADPHAQVLVLIHDRAIGVAVVTAVVSLLDERPGFLLFVLFGVDEFLDVRMPILKRVHLGCTPGFPAALDHVRDLVVDFQKRKRAARFAAAAQFLARAASVEKGPPRPAAIFE